MYRISRINIIALFLALFTSTLITFGATYPVYADTDASVSYYFSIQSPQRAVRINNSWTSWSTGDLYAVNAYTFNGVRFRKNNGTAIGGTASYYSLDMYLNISNLNDYLRDGIKVNTSGLTTDMTCNIIEISTDGYNYNSIGTLYAIYHIYGYCENGGGNYVGIPLYFSASTESSGSADYSIDLKFGNLTFWKPINATTGSPDYTSDITAIKNSVNNINTSINRLNSNQEQSNQDANDRYQDEKDTIREESDNAKESAENLDFSFTLNNPFAVIWNSLTGSSCVDIPILGSWLHLSSTHICTPWSSTVRNALGAVFGIGSTMLLFAFIMRKILGTGSNFNGSIEI